jgi:hypothetical protein
VSDIDKALGAAVGSVVLGALFAWERRVSGPNLTTTVGVVACAVVAVFSVAVVAVCLLYELGSGREHDK